LDLECTADDYFVYPKEWYPYQKIKQNIIKTKTNILRTKKNAQEQKGCLKSIFKYMQV
jgi:hypothetical protein